MKPFKTFKRTMVNSYGRTLGPLKKVRNNSDFNLNFFYLRRLKSNSEKKKSEF